MKSSNDQGDFFDDFANEDKDQIEYVNNNKKKFLDKSSVSGARKLFTAVTSFVLLPTSLYSAYKNSENDTEQEDSKLLEKSFFKESLLIDENKKNTLKDSVEKNDKSNKKELTDYEKLKPWSDYGFFGKALWLWRGVKWAIPAWLDGFRE